MNIRKYGPGATTNLRQRFFLWSTLLLVSGGIILSALSYWNTRRLLMAEAMTRSEVILQEVEAIRAYVKEVLRPKMLELHGRNTFIIEAMSTTYVSTRIMERFSDIMPNYVYRRASVNPHNPGNRADLFEEEMLDWFEEDGSRLFWQGIVHKKNKAFFVSMVPDYFTPPCIRCHGTVEQAPPELVERYGPDGGFRFKAGDLAGIDSVAVPVSESLRAAWYGSLKIFATTLLVTLVWLWLFNLLFHRLVIERLGTMLSLLPGNNDEHREKGGGDELDELQASLGSLDQYVRSARKGAGLQPNFVGNYVVQQPVSAGAMSWLYSGVESSSSEPVSLKFGFDEVMQNPLYRSCFETELQLFTTLSHVSLPKVKERLGDVLVLQEVKGRVLSLPGASKKLDDFLVLPVFLQLCDLVATLHAAGVVHHDLRPHVMTLHESHLYLFDMGLASVDSQEDPIVAAGLGPQGDLHYMAPEVIMGKRGDPRSDIYGLGVLLYMAVTGLHPFGEEQKSLKQWVQYKQNITLPKAQRKGQALAVEAIILKALAARSTERYQWVEDFRDDLQQALNTSG